ncbi:hypothetical protein AAW51_0407 [Caldimonas brevitalea]|uniref:PKD domain-containing protein n=2 Tax=Caldimonas brevitalea TaxID=413882 RepID=A0A0G3BGJ3_9BURK|nr:hypothetical protein AAW51_0407 [Caldimonas brevitalea]
MGMGRLGSVLVVVAGVLLGCGGGGGGDDRSGDRATVEISMSSGARAVAGRELVFAASGSTASGSPVTFEWNFGDGAPMATGGLVQHTFSDQGHYTVTVTLRSQSGATAVARRDLDIVLNTAPSDIVIEWPSQTIPAHAAVHFVGRAIDADGDPITYRWNFGDGQTATGRALIHAFPAAGSYNVVLTADDGHGGVSQTAVPVSVVSAAMPLPVPEAKTWAKHTTGFSGALYASAWPTPTTGYVGGESGTLLRSEDGGATWVPRPVGATDVTVRALHFFDADNGLAATSGGHHVVYHDNGYTVYSDWGRLLKTSDGGRTWVNLDAGYTGPGASDFHFIDRLNGWAVGANGFIAKTSDGGLTWTYQRSGTKQHLRNVQFIDALRGWAMSEKDTVLRTVDGGATWTATVLPFELDYLDGMSFSDDRHGWVAGHRIFMSIQFLFRTTDGGVTWQRMPGPPDGAIHDDGPSAALGDIVATGPNSLYILDLSGDLYATTDAGASWNLKATTNAANGYAITDLTIDTARTAHAIHYIGGQVFSVSLD